MTQAEAIAELDALDGGDTEADHIAADRVLRAFLTETYPRVADAYDRVEERAGGFWFA